MSPLLFMLIAVTLGAIFAHVMPSWHDLDD
jgi:hypothetical protein